VAALGGSVNVAVMTQYVTSGLRGDITVQSANPVKVFAKQSISIFVTFGSLWVGGLCLIGFHLMVYQPSKVLSANGHIVVSRPSMRRTLPVDSIRGEVVPSLATENDVIHILTWYNAIEAYFWSIMPSVYQPQDWWKRLWLQLTLHHKYISAIFQLFNATMGKQSMNRSHLSHTRKKSTLQLLHLLSSITFACSVLALLFDQQYPEDDGYCGNHTERATCLARTTMLDPKRRFCTWVNIEEEASAGTLIETRGDILLKLIPIHDETLLGTKPCSFNDASPSEKVVLAAMMITSVLLIPVAALLNILFAIVEADPRNNTEHVHLSRVSDAPSSEYPDDDGSKRGHIEYPSKETISNIPGEFPAKVDFIRQHSRIVPLEKFHASSTDTHLPEEETIHFWQILHPMEGAPMAPLEVQSCRHAVVREILESNYHLPASLTIQTMSSSVSTTPPANKEDTKSAVSTLCHKLRHASETETGMSLLHVFLCDIFTQQAPKTQQRSGSSVFAAVLARSFTLRKTVHARVQVVAIGLLIVMNLAALYFVALKGATRSVTWQMNLLRVCLVEWCVEVFFHQSVEVYIVEYLVPSTVHADVLALMRRVLTLVAEYVRVVHLCRIQQQQQQQATRVENIDLSLADSVSVLVAKETSAGVGVGVDGKTNSKKQIWESEFVLFAASRQLDSTDLAVAMREQMHRRVLEIGPKSLDAVIDEDDEDDDDDEGKRSSQRSSRQWYTGMSASDWSEECLCWLSKRPEATQRIVAYLVSSAIFGVMFFTWIVLRPLGSAGAVIMAGLVLTIALLVCATAWHCHSRHSRFREADNDSVDVFFRQHLHCNLANVLRSSMIHEKSSTSDAYSSASLSSAARLEISISNASPLSSSNDLANDDDSLHNLHKNSLRRRDVPSCDDDDDTVSSSMEDESLSFLSVSFMESDEEQDSQLHSSSDDRYY
jgi:hypothetical protein